MKEPVYLDYAAATPLDPEVFSAMQPFFSERFYNPSALYLASRDVKKTIEAARASVAQDIGARPSEIIFTAGGTEANSLAIRGIMERHPGKKMLISSVEHEAVRMPAGLFDVSEISVDRHGVVDIEDLKKQMTDDVVLVSVIYANNEVGTVQDIAEIAEIIDATRRDRVGRKITTPLIFHTDACQATGYLPLSVSRLGVDLLTVNGGKIYGPKQSGILYVKAGIVLNPLILGGGQEKGLRSGTENVAAMIGFAAALKKARRFAKDESKRLRSLRQMLRHELESLDFGIIFHGHPDRRLPNHLSFAVPGIDNERLMMMLDERGFQVATGSACSASKEEASHVLLAMGVSAEIARATIRVTLGQMTLERNVRQFVGALANAVRENI